MTKFNMIRDINGFNGFGLDFSLDNTRTTLAANAEQTHTVPSGAPNYIAVFSFSPGTNIFVNLNATATVPSGSFDTDTSQLNPIGRHVKAGDVLHFVTADTTNPYVNISYYVVQPYSGA